MDVHCTTCGEPWDADHLRHDAIAETHLDEDEIQKWHSLPPEERLAEPYRAALKDAGYEFGRSVINITRCPACPPDAKANPETLYLKAEMENILAGDEDGLVAQYEDLRL